MAACVLLVVCSWDCVVLCLCCGVLVLVVPIRACVQCSVVGVVQCRWLRLGGVSIEREERREKEAGEREKAARKEKEEALRARGLRHAALTPLPAVAQKKPNLSQSLLPLGENAGGPSCVVCVWASRVHSIRG